MPKTIWIYHHYADPPDGHWTGTFDLHKHLAARGHNVTVLTSSFSHYSRRETRLTPDQDSVERIYDGVRFVFLRTRPYHSNGSARLGNMLDFARRSERWGRKAKEAPDVVIGASPHPWCAMAASRVARRRGARFFFEVHDLWPRFPIEVGLLPKWHPAALYLAHMERKLLERADLVLPLWPRMSEYFKQFGVPEARVLWMPLGVDAVTLDPPALPQVNDRPFVAMYRGRFGLTNNVRNLLESAKLLQERGRDDILVQFVGEGEGREAVVAQAKRQELRNVEFRDFLPKEQMVQDMAQADLLVGSIPALPHFNAYGMISTKLLEYLAMHRPIVFAAGDPDHIVREAGAGIVVPPEDPVALANAIERIADMDHKEREEMAANGVRYVRREHDLRALAAKLEAAL